MDTRRKRLLYRAKHRGTKEADLVVGGFVQSHITALVEVELEDLELLLEISDADLMDWVTGRKEVPDSIENPFIVLLLDYYKSTLTS